jgi:Mrp family chromosome partitioning ATPase
MLAVLVAAAAPATALATALDVAAAEVVAGDFDLLRRNLCLMGGAEKTGEPSPLGSFISPRSSSSSLF